MKPIPWPPITGFLCGAECYRFYGVYRIIVGTALGFLGLTLLLVGVTSSRDKRALIQDGFWPLKLVGFAGIVGALWYSGLLLDWMFIPSCLMAGLFLVAQSILLVDFSYEMADWMLERAERVIEGYNWYLISLVAVTVCSQAFTWGASIFLWIQFPGNLPRVVTLVTLSLNALMTLCSVLEAVREANPNAGLLQSSILGSYITFLLITAITGDPQIHPSSEFSQTVGYLAVLATVFSVAYTAYSTGGASHKLLSSSAGLPTTSVAKASDGDDEVAEYNYAVYQFVFVCATLYTGLLITGWKRRAIVNGVFTLVDVRLTFWIKVTTSWLVALLYIWSLFAPIILNHRRFY